MKSLLSFSYTTSDVLGRYQHSLARQDGEVYFVPPTLFEVLHNCISANIEVPSQLAVPSFHSYKFVFWSIFVGGKHWCAGVHSIRDKSHLYYMDTWGTEKDVRQRMPAHLIAAINLFLQQQNPPSIIVDAQLIDVPRQKECECGCCVNELARRLCDGTLFSNAMQPFEQSVLLRVTQAKVIFDQVLSP